MDGIADGTADGLVIQRQYMVMDGIVGTTDMVMAGIITAGITMAGTT